MLFLETGGGLTLEDTLKVSNGTTIMVSNNSNPEVNDWNEDGNKDLIIGEQSYVAPYTGNIRLYTNTGTNSAPSFDDYTVLQAGGSDIYHYRANPRVYDLDQDGLKDLLVGNDNGMIYFYKNSGTNANPVFTTSEYLRKYDGTAIDAYYGSRFCIVDWNEDGDLDILVSGYDGFIEYYENSTIGVEEHTITVPLHQVTTAPNPATNKVVFKFHVNEPTHVRITVYSAEGRLVATLFEQYEEPGEHTWTWNPRENNSGQLTAGVYFAEITAGQHTETARILIIK